MSKDSEQQNAGQLQHAAEHERPPRKHSSVLLYLVILFAAAFLLLLMSFLMQQRANQEAMDNLQQTSHSTVESLENKLEEMKTLQKQVEELEQTNRQQAEELEKQQAALADLEQQSHQLEAMQWFWQIDDYYARGYYTKARQMIADFEARGLHEALPTENTTGTDRFSPAERYEEIKEALN